MVTAQFVVIDTTEHTGMIYHRGHVFPFRKAVNEKWFLQDCIVAPPLGVKKNVATPGVDFCLSPGERWMLYTDGLVESLTENFDNTMKIAAFQEYLDTRPNIAIKEACVDIIDHHPSFQTGSPQPDDYTVVLFERASGVE
jgi:serine phosphatase RsbU (regulator of sigma subunit)